MMESSFPWEYLLFEGATKGKTITALRNSKSSRNALIALFGGPGCVPSSIMRAKESGRLGADGDEEATKRNYDETAPYIEKSRKAKQKVLKDAFSISGRGCGNGALSKFFQGIGRSMVLLYSEPGQTVFDPFAGHNSRMELCVKAGRNYIGCDLSTKFMEFNQKRARQLRGKFPAVTIQLHHVDSRKVPVKSESADFTITSPPYYDIEYYGDEPEQLGKSQSYKEFLEGLQQVMHENFRVLRSGSFAVWFVNDFRRKKKFHLYHVDTIRLAKKAGFEPHDLLVVDLGNSIRDCFTNQIVETRIIPKRHEYGLVFRKPESVDDNS